MSSDPSQRCLPPSGIAAQHRYLADRIRELRHGLSSDERSAATRLEQLLDDFVQHFALEEQLMSRGGYPGIAGHQREHASFLERIRAMRARCHEPSSELMGLLVDTLHSWFTKHESSSDRHAAEFLKIDDW